MKSEMALRLLKRQDNSTIPSAIGLINAADERGRNGIHPEAHDAARSDNPLYGGDAIGASLVTAIGVDLVLSKEDGIGKLDEHIKALMPVPIDDSGRQNRDANLEPPPDKPVQYRDLRFNFNVVRRRLRPGEPRQLVVNVPPLVRKPLVRKKPLRRQK